MAWLLRVSPTILIFLFTFLSHQTEKYVTPVTSFHNTLTNHDEVFLCFVMFATTPVFYKSMLGCYPCSSLVIFLTKMFIFVFNANASKTRSSVSAIFGLREYRSLAMFDLNFQSGI